MEALNRHRRSKHVGGRKPLKGWAIRKRLTSVLRNSRIGTRPSSSYSRRLSTASQRPCLTAVMGHWLRFTSMLTSISRCAIGVGMVTISRSARSSSVKNTGWPSSVVLGASSNVNTTTTRSS